MLVKGPLAALKMIGVTERLPVVQTTLLSTTHFNVSLTHLSLNKIDNILETTICTDFAVSITSQKAKFMGPIWGPPGSCRPQMGPMLAPWTLLSGIIFKDDDAVLFTHWGQMVHIYISKLATGQTPSPLTAIPERKACLVRNHYLKQC